MKGNSSRMQSFDRQVGITKTEIQEHEILRIAGRLDPKKDTSVDAVRDEVLKWVQKKSGNELPEPAWKYGSFENFSGGRNSVAARIKDERMDFWSVRADDPDKNIAGRIWTTEVVVGQSNKNHPLFSVRLLVSTVESKIDILPHVPAFVGHIADKSKLYCGPYRIIRDPWVIDSGPAMDHFENMLVDENRKIPMFVLSVPESTTNTRKPLINAKSLSYATLGLAHVIVLTAEYAWKLTELFGKRRSVFNGGVRAYLPGFKKDSDPKDHRLVIADQFSREEGIYQCERWLRMLAATESVKRLRLGRDVVAFSVLRDIEIQTKQKELERAGASDTLQLEVAKERIKALEGQLEEKESIIDYFDSEHKKAEERAIDAENNARANVYRIQELLGLLESKDVDVPDSIQNSDSWGSFPEWCDTHFAGEVVLSPLARRNVRSPLFGDVALVCRCIKWLATHCRNCRIDGGEGSLRDQYIEEGVRNSYCGSDEFDVDWNGERHTADWHIKNGGNTRDPRRCLRIYYFWDQNSQQIVVADMPAHRRTGAT